MNMSEKLFEKEFSGKSAKAAYLECCKWLSTNIIAVNNSENITYRIEKKEVKLWSAIVKLTVYVTADEGEIQQRHCEICREVSSNFFMSHNKHMCESCSVPPYRRRLKTRLESIKNGMKGKIL